MSTFSCLSLNIRPRSSWFSSLQTLGLTLAALVLRPSHGTELYNRFPGSLSLQTADHGTSRPPYHGESIPIINLLLHMFIYLSIVSQLALFPWRTLTNTEVKGTDLTCRFVLRGEGRLSVRFLDSGFSHAWSSLSPRAHLLSIS